MYNNLLQLVPGKYTRTCSISHVSLSPSTQNYLQQICNFISEKKNLTRHYEFTTKNIETETIDVECLDFKLQAT